MLIDFEELLKNSDPMCFTYQHVTCLYKLFLSVQLQACCQGQVFDKVQGAVRFNQQNKRLDKMPSNAKKDPSKKMYKNYLMSFF